MPFTDERIYEILGIKKIQGKFKFQIRYKEGEYDLNEVLSHLAEKFLILRASINKNEYRKDFLSPDHIMVNCEKVDSDDIKKMRSDIKALKEIASIQETALGLYGHNNNWHGRYNPRKESQEYHSKNKLGRVGYWAARDALRESRRIRNENSIDYNY